MPESAPPPDPMIVRMPIVRLVQDGERTVFQVVGSTLTPPGSMNGRYLGVNGYVESIADAVNVRGPAGGSAAGTQGPKGDPGIDGKSAYTIWLEAGSSGTRADFLASIKGERGIDGLAGVKGDQGERGIKGDAGPSGSALIGQVAIGQNAVVAISLGVREVTVALAGTVPGERYLPFCRAYRLNNGSLTSGRPAGYWLIEAVCNVSGQITVVLNAPLLAIGASYSMSIDIVRVNA